MRVVKPNSTLNLDSSIMGINEYDAIGLLFMYIGLSYFMADTPILTFLPLILTLIALILLIRIRLKYRRKIIRDSLSHFLQWLVWGRSIDLESNSLIEILNYNGLNFWLTKDKKIGLSFKTQAFDSEVDGVNEFDYNMQGFLRSLSDKIQVTVSSISSNEFNEELDHARSEAVNFIGLVKFTHEIHFEMSFCSGIINFVKNYVFTRSDSEHIVKLFLEELNLENSESYLKELKPFSKDEILQKFRKKDNIYKKGSVLHTPSSHITILKMESLSNHELPVDSINSLLEMIPAPVNINIKFKKINKLWMLKKAFRTRKKEEKGSSKTSRVKAIEAENTATSVELNNTEFFEIELHLLVERISKQELLRVTQKILSFTQGNLNLRTQNMGVFNSLKAIVPGTKTHFTQIESLHNTVMYLPLLKSSSQNTDRKQKHTLCYQRKNKANDYFIVNNSNYDHYSGVILGKSGSGKSTLLNTMVNSHHHNENIQQIIVDVKGSHKRLVESLNGKVINFDLNSAPNDNPFKILNLDRSEDSFSLVVNFIETLVLEPSEIRLPLSEKAILEEELTNYIENTDIKSLNMHDFIDSVEKFNRKNVLKRWGKRGVYKKIFSLERSQALESAFKERLVYFCFNDIHSASNQELSKVIMNMVMLNFHYRLKTKKLNEFIKFINDEVKFFLDIFHNQLDLLSSNLRKLNGGILLIAQDPSSLIINGNPFLLSHTDYKFIFKLDDINDEERQALGISREVKNKIMNLKSIKGQYSNFMLVDNIGSREGFLRLSPYEYYRASTFAKDNEIFEKVKKEFSLTSEEAIEILARVSLIKGSDNYAL